MKFLLVLLLLAGCSPTSVDRPGHVICVNPDGSKAFDGVVTTDISIPEHGGPIKIFDANGRLHTLTWTACTITILR